MERKSQQGHATGQKLIWEREPSWDQIGTEQMRDPNSRMSTRVFGRRRRWRLVCRLFKKERGKHHDLVHLAHEARDLQRQITVLERQRMCAVAARLSRRPPNFTPAEEEQFWSLRTVQQIRELSFGEFRTFIRTVFLRRAEYPCARTSMPTNKHVSTP